jgi:hypothetical protein
MNVSEHQLKEEEEEEVYILIEYILLSQSR